MAPSASFHPSTSRLLLTDTDPKSRPKATPTALNSGSSSSTTAAPHTEKKTRDQPNFSDCHCCGCRINSTNPNERLQPLDSVWRIVLLCRKCSRNIHCGKTCPYCFRGTGNSGEFVTCRVCARKIHNGCVSNYGNYTPWCYSGVGPEGFMVCVDCWVPQLLKNSIRVYEKGGNKCGLKEKGDGEKSTENVVKKVKARAKVEKNIVLGLPAKKDDDMPKVENLNSSESVEVSVDADVAIQLHRSINSSPRFLRTRSELKSSGDFDVLNIVEWNGLSYKRSRLGKNHGKDQNLGTCTNTAENGRMNLLGEIDYWINSTGLNLGIQCYQRDKTRKIWKLVEDSECKSSHPEEMKCNLNSGDAKTRFSINSDQINVERLWPELLIYKRSGLKRKLFQVYGERSSLNNQGPELKPESYQIDDKELMLDCQVKSCDADRDRYHLKYCRRATGTKSESNLMPFNTLLSCDADRNRYHLKYCRRATGTKSESTSMRFNTLLSQYMASDHASKTLEVGFGEDRDRYHLKYGKKASGTKLDSSLHRYNNLQSENQASEPALSQSVSGCSVSSDDKLGLEMGTVNQDRDRFCYKYTKRVKRSKSCSISGTKLHSGVLPKEMETSTAALATNCYAESRTTSDVYV